MGPETTIRTEAFRVYNPYSARDSIRLLGQSLFVLE